MVFILKDIMKKLLFISIFTLIFTLSWAQCSSQCAIFTPSMSITQVNPGSPPFGEDVTKAIDGNSGTKYLNFNKTNTGLVVNTGRNSIANRMDLTTANDFPERDPVNYTIEGSNNGSSWTTITSGNIPCNSNRFLTRSFNFTNTTSYSWYRIVFPSLCNVGLANSMQIGEIQLFQTNTVSPSITINASSNNICQGTNVTFTPTPTNGGLTPTYQWKVNGVNVATGPTYSSTALAQGNTISCVMTSNASCLTTTTATSNTISMNVTTRVTPTHSITNDVPVTNVCEGTTLFFTASSRNGGTPTYQWKVNGVNVGTNSTFIFFTPSNLKNNDVVSCTMTSTLSCVTTTTVNSNTIQVGIISKVPTAVTILGSPSVNRKSTITLTANPTNGGPTPYYEWYKNDFFVANGPEYTDTAWVVGSTDIQLMMMSSLQCVTSSTVWANFTYNVLNLQEVKYFQHLDSIHFQFVKNKEDMVEVYGFNAVTGKATWITTTDEMTFTLPSIWKYYYINSGRYKKYIGPFELVVDEPKKVLSVKQILGQIVE
jgi:hypothetical protein